jgi:hypothetical protein
MFKTSILTFQRTWPKLRSLEHVLATQKKYQQPYQTFRKINKQLKAILNKKKPIFSCINQNKN